jgi:spermidine/putrescine ABC transporter ATP-binding subunit
MSSVELRGIAKSFGSAPAVHPLDFSVRDGEFLSILGPSGSGKTTLLRMIAGFEQPDKGTISIGGREVSRLSPDRRNLGVVFQSYALFPHMTVLDNVGFGLRMRGIMKRDRNTRAAEALALVGLSGFEGRLPRQLSGGQQQRVALARAIVFEPDVLLLDEPLGALDLKLRKRMQLELKQLHRTLKRTFIYVTHDQEEALTMSDRVAVMDGGRVLQVDTPEAIYHNPSSSFVAEFLGESNLIPGTVCGGRNSETARFKGPAGMYFDLPRIGRIEADVPALLSVRPERVIISETDGEAGTVIFAATLEAVVFKGAWISVVARIGSGTRCEALISNDGRAMLKLPAPGQVVRMAFRPQDARLLEGTP